MSMKKVLLGLTVSLTFTVSFSQTAKYHPFPDSNATWFSGKGWCPCPPYVGIQVNIWNWITGDTIIGIYTYKKIQEYTYRQNDGATSFGYVGAFRQDTSQRQIFLRLPSATADTLLYDFNLSIGDTIPRWYVNPLYPWNTIYSIDSILIGATYRKRFHIAGIDSIEILIEGIGSSYGLLLPMDKGVEHGSKLNCYTQNSQNLYMDSVVGYCQSPPLNVAEQNDNRALAIYPNPFSIQTTLQTYMTLNNATITVDNCFGQTVKQIKNISGQTVTFSRDNLAGGLYFVHVTQDNQLIATKKLVIADK